MSDATTSLTELVDSSPSPTIRMEIPSVDSEIKVFNSFDDMGLPEDLLRGIYAHGFDIPSKIQQRAIVPMKEGRDIIAQAQSGTGKTGTFSIGALSVLDPTLKVPQVLVLSPTRELAQQTEKVAREIGNYMKR
jgi:ATP-dependent RNA helicase